MSATTGSHAGELSSGALSPFAGAPDRPVFVGGCPRSGTTLLRTMLNSHPELAMPRESRFLLETWRRRERFGDLGVERNREKLARWIFTRKAARPGRVGVESQRAIERLVAAPPTVGSLLGTCFLMYAEQQGKERWGDKRPMYVQYLDAIFAMFPDAQFVNVVRDPRAAVASMRRLDWYGGDVVPVAELWERSQRAADAWRRRLAPDQLLEIRYEDLVARPEETLTDVCSFLRLSGDGIADALSYHEHNDIPETSTYHWKVHQPVSADSSRRWEHELSGEEIALIEYAAGKRLRRYGYEPAAGSSRPTAEMYRALRRRRLERAKLAGRRQMKELKLRLTHRQPVVARLTSGQRR
ncbi:sulfotransferase [Haloechinothrix sp. YIM 98757]|uniref:Sulfotransferase n=1 Tax=Haloechinothrix aidingensis TaxID=2752311 RepID=A0A838A7W1_9PSEU|nr:sulfotransferase [Haloechinothrix aidingensis]